MRAVRREREQTLIVNLISKRRFVKGNLIWFSFETLKTEESIKAKERSRTAMRPREREDKPRTLESSLPRAGSATKEEPNYERFGRYG